MANKAARANFGGLGGCNGRDGGAKIVTGNSEVTLAYGGRFDNNLANFYFELKK